MYYAECAREPRGEAYRLMMRLWGWFRETGAAQAALREA
jgi:hypothetical protein